MPIENVIQPMAPINPMQDVQNYLTLLNQGQQLGVQQAEMDKRQAEIAQQQRYEQEQAVFLSNPNPTLKDAVRFMGAMSPAQQSAFSPVFKQIDEKELRSSLMFGGQLISALGSDPAVAQRLLKERIEAERNSGNTQAAMFLEQVSNQASTSPSNAMKSVTMFMSAIPGAGEYMSSQYSAGQEFRAQELAPLQQQSERALAGQRQASAAESMAGVSLKQAQADTSRQLAQKYLVETSKTLKEVAGENGAIPEKDKPDMELKLRKEYNTETKSYKDVLESYRRIEATEDTAVGDISLIFAYMKMLDPVSVVREGEQATAQNARGVPDTVMNVYNRALSGERLTENQRKQFRSQANKLAEAAKKTEKTVRTGLTRISKKYGLNSENIFYDVEPSGDNVNNVPPPPGFTERK